MKKILSIILSITMLFTLSTAVFADGVDAPKQVDTITVGINAEFTPFEYIDENNQFAGFDIDLMNYIGESIERYGIVFPDNFAEKAKVLEAAGEKADMLSFMTEIYDALGEESITIGKIYK